MAMMKEETWHGDSVPRGRRPIIRGSPLTGPLRKRRRTDRPVPSPCSQTVSATDDIQLNAPQTLYRRWEESQWSPFDVELATDREHWTAMSGDDRRVVLFVLSSLMVAEERITTKFSGLVGAYGTEEEATFLATQQVDEARHMQFYARFQDEVIAAPDLIGAHVARARAQVSDAFRRLFDEALVQAHEQLVAEPANLAAKVRFVVVYHLILEATLGLTTFRFTTDHLTREGLLPGFVEGYSRIHHDETRHIGYGMWFLRETVRARPETGDVVRRTLRDLLPSVAASLKPPPSEGEGAESVLGVTEDEIRAFALAGLTRRLDIVGVPLATL
jgi:ribonucleoside-diphosphate reductase beta chain